ncbi:MAG TPA: tetratricopeptide repeat protein [Chthoniobacteraceae bacterium]
MGGPGMKAAILVSLSVFVGGLALGQNIVLTDGSIIATKGIVRRSGDLIMARVERQMPASAAGTVAAAAPVDEVGYPVQKIAKIEFPEPPQLKAASALIAQGKFAEANVQLDPVFRYYEGFRDAPGSWWSDASVLRVSAFLSQGKDQEAASLVDQLTRFATEPKTTLAARALSAALLTRRGEYARAVQLFEGVMKESAAPEVLAVAAIYKGQSHLGLKQYDPAVLAFLQIPVFFPEEKHLLPASTLGAARGYIGLEDRARARETLERLIKDFPASPEAAQAKQELVRIDRIESGSPPPK